MGIFNLGKPRWQHKDPVIRRDAILAAEKIELETLMEIAGSDPDLGVQLAAVERLSDLPALIVLSGRVGEQEVLDAINRKKDNLLCRKIFEAADPGDCDLDLALLSDPSKLTDIACHGPHLETKLAALARISSETELTALLAKPCGKEVSRAAVSRIEREELLREVFKKASSKTARRLAGQKLAAIEEQRAARDNRAVVRKRLAEIILALKKLIDGSSDLDSLQEQLAGLTGEWSDLTAEEKDPRQEEFAALVRNIEEHCRQIMETRERELRKAEKYGKMVSQLTAACETIEKLSVSPAEDSLDKMAAAREAGEQACQSEGLTPPSSLITRFREACRNFKKNHELIDQEKERLAALLKEVELIDAAIAAGDTTGAETARRRLDKKIAGGKFKLLSTRDLSTRLTASNTSLAELIQQNLQDNLEKRRALCAELNDLAETFKPDQADGQIRRIQSLWRKLGNLPKDQDDGLSARFEEGIKRLTELKDDHFAEREWQLWANLKLKEKLLARVNELDKLDDLPTIFKQVKKAQAEWKEIGPLPRKITQQMWDDFHEACEKNFNRCLPYLEELKEKRVQAMARKTEICQLAEELSKSSDWQKTSDELKAFQQEWNDLLRGDRQDEKKLFKRFRAACDQFFTRRAEAYAQLDQERAGNLKLKTELCREAEQLAAAPEPANVKPLLALQKRWREIGPAPRGQEKAIWKKFRASCDKFFNCLEEQRLENLKQKEQICEELESITAGLAEGADRRPAAKLITELQKRWKEIGPVPKDRQEALWQRFHDPCEVFFTDLHRQFDLEDRERRQHQTIKEDLLQQAEELVENETDPGKTADGLKALQKAWQEAGTAPREHETALNRQFRTLCNNFFEGRRQQFTELKQERQANLKQKEILCLKLENIVGTAGKSVSTGRDKALTLAEELKLAMEENFVLAGRRKDKKAMDKEVKKIQEEWQKLGAVPRRHESALNRRFHQALDRHYRSRKESRASE